MRPPRPLSLHGDGGFAAGQQDDRSGRGLAPQRGLTRDAGHHPADLARFALKRVAQDQRGHAGLPGDFGRCLER